ncbi:MAG: biotin--[acetyl-CoA-carboxylase] ligase [Thermoanaerobaculia bacterium]
MEKDLTGAPLTAQRPAPTVEALCQEWQRGLGGAPGTPLGGIFHSRIDSTQRLARTLLDQCVHEDEGPLPFVVVALEQQAGRGREGRSWWSPAGAGLYASLVLPVPDRERLQDLPVRVAVALAEYVNRTLGDGCRIKWPNDLVVDREKLGGILVDAVTPAPPADSWAIVGVGLNYLVPISGRLENATALVEASASRGKAAPDFVPFVIGALTALWNAATSEESGWGDRYAHLAVHKPGDRLRFRLGAEEVEGTFAGFDARGFLRLTTADGERQVRSGEVFSW